MLQNSTTSGNPFTPGFERRSQLQASGLLAYTWDDWDDDYNDPVANGQNRTVAQVMLDYLKYLANGGPKQHVWLRGPPGCGKTHIACVTATLWALVRDIDAVYCNWASRLAEIKDSFNGWTAEGLEVEQHTGILVLDDMGAERVTLFNEECLYRIIESRHRCPIIFTSNYTIEHYTARLKVSDRRDDNADSVKYQAQKIEDRLQTGQGGVLLTEVSVLSNKGSYRRLE